MAKIKTGDTVMVMTGKDRGRQGKVRQVAPKEHRLIVEGLNMVKRHRKATRVGQPSGIIDKEAPLDVSNVMLICPSCGKPTRVGFRFLDNGAKVRWCKQCEAAIE